MDNIAIQWMMKLNVGKCEILYVEGKKIRVLVQGCELTILTQETHMGITVDSSMISAWSAALN